MRRRRIGLILGTKEAFYPKAIRMGVQNTLDQSGATLVNICDLIPYHTHANTRIYLAVAFELASHLDLDATIVPVGTVAGYLGNDDALARQMTGRLDPSRVVAIERAVEGARSIGKDGKPGMRECMRHLIDECGLRRIAFVSGSALSAGAREREGVYFEEMAAAGLTVEEGMFTRGDFRGECPEAIERILAACPDVEAIACANDQIAFCAYDVLRAHGIVVGRDVAVTGFDDQPQSVHADPPLSTVHVTGYDYGCMAAREALRLCAGKDQQEFVFTGSFMARASTGATATDMHRRLCGLMAERPFPIDEVTDIIVDTTLEMADTDSRRRYRDVVRAFVTREQVAIHEHLVHPEPTDVLITPQDIATLLPDDLSEYLSLEGFHTIAVQIIEALAEKSDDRLSHWLLAQAAQLHLHVARMQNMLLTRRSHEHDHREWMTFRLAEGALFDSSESGEVLAHIMGDLSRLGVVQADLYTFEESITVIEGSIPTMPDTARHVALLRRGITCAIEHPETHLLCDILDAGGGGTCGTGPYSAAPLMAGNELLGILVLDPGTLADNGQLMAILNCGLAVKQLQVLEHEREANEILSRTNAALARQSRHDELTGLLNRRGLDESLSFALRGRGRSLAAIVYADLDGLKQINDELGHETGDEAIRTCARLLDETLPADALISRIGGDEFVAFVLFDGDETTDLESLLLEATEALNQEGRLPFRLSISFGVDTIEIHDAKSPDSLTQAMRRADQRMYEMKELNHRMLGLGAPRSR